MADEIWLPFGVRSLINWHEFNLNTKQLLSEQWDGLTDGAKVVGAVGISISFLLNGVSFAGYAFLSVISFGILPATDYVVSFIAAQCCGYDGYAFGAANA